MKIIVCLAAVFALAGLASVCAGEASGFKSDKDKLGYVLGLSIGGEVRKNLAQLGEEVDLPQVLNGLTDALTSAAPKVSDEEAQTVMEAFGKRAMAKQQEHAKLDAEKDRVVSDKNVKDGEAFLAANKTKEGVKTTASGLQYKVIKEGTGATPKATDTVSTHYRGTLIDGTEFDSSYSRNQPAEFPVNGVIRGWTEALQLMKVGAKYQLFIPANLAYGERGRGEKIGPNATLIFELELLDIVKK